MLVATDAMRAVTSRASVVRRSMPLAISSQVAPTSVIIEALESARAEMLTRPADISVDVAKSCSLATAKS